MAIRKIAFSPGEYYHLYNRGNSKQKIFRDKRDYARFVELLYLCNTNRSFVAQYISKNHFDFYRPDTLVDIGAYCLMPNHFHILVKEKEEGGISRFMQKLSTAYVMYFNTRHERSGGLFEGKFKAEYIDNDRYLKYIFSYIHLNPLKLIDKNWKLHGLKSRTGTEKFLKEYRFSSHDEYLGEKRVQSAIIFQQAFPKYFPQPKDFIAEIGDWIKYTQ